MPRTLVAATALVAAAAMTAPAAALPDPGLARAAPSGAGDATVLVGFEAGADVPAVHDLVGVGEVAHVIDQIDVHVVAVPAGTVDLAIAAFEGVEGVAYAEPNHELELLGGPDDPQLDDQYQLDHINAVQGFELYNEAVDAEAYASTGGGRLAILDSGIDLLHPEFADKVVHCASYLTGLGVGVPEVCQDNNFHGTYVAGIAAAIADNGEGIAGVAFDADLLVYQVCTLACFTADSAAAMVDAADDGAEVANYSFGGPASNETGRRAVEYAHEAGVLQVASAGNSGDEGHDSVGFPAGYPEVVAVGATNEDRERAGFSSYGPEVEITAPGDLILSTLPGGLYADNFSGTSFSGPAVAGLGALLRNLGLDAEEARQALIDGADPTAVGETGFTDEHGHGMADVAGSVRVALDGTDGGSDEDTDDGGSGTGDGPPEGRGNGNGPPEGRGPNR